MSNILVTGSEGSLMREVVPKLLKQGHIVYGVDNLLNGQEPTSLGVNYNFIKGDLTNRNVVEYAMSGMDSVIQAAARIYGVTGFHRNAADILGEDLTLHNNVLRAAVLHGVKHVTYISSSMVYEGFPFDKLDTLDLDGFKEEDALKYVPSTDYGLSKFTGERLSMAFQKQYGINYTIWRPFNIISPHESSKEDFGISHVFADFIKHIVIEGKNPIPIIGDGHQIRCFTWIDEVAEAIASNQCNEKTINETFNLGNKEPILMYGLATLIHEEAWNLGLMKGERKPLEFIHHEAYSDDVKFRVPDVSKAENLLGWKASVPVRESVRRCLQQIT